MPPWLQDKAVWKYAYIKLHTVNQFRIELQLIKYLLLSPALDEFKQLLSFFMHYQLALSSAWIAADESLRHQEIVKNFGNAESQTWAGE